MGIRRATRLLVLLAALAGTAWLAAPALSVQPYLPQAVDFEQRLPTVRELAPKSAAARAADPRDPFHPAADGPIRFQTDPIRAPRRFDAVGLAREIRSLEFRARKSGRPWGPWAETADGNPLYVGGADYVQVRSRTFKPAGRLHYVNVTGSATPVSRVLSGARRALNSAFLSAASVLDSPAEAIPDKPKMTSRSAWGANRDSGGCKPRNDPDYGEVRGAAVHHTATSNKYRYSEGPGIVLAICRYHRNANGWSDIGYNALADKYGRTYAGREDGDLEGPAVAKPVVGAHAGGQNSVTTGIATIGTHTSKKMNNKAFYALRAFLAWKLELHGVTNAFTYITYNNGRVARTLTTHRTLVKGTQYATSCPGDAGASQMPALRTATQRRMDNH